MIGYAPRKYTPVTDVTPYEKMINQYCRKFGISIEQLRSKYETRMPVRRIGGIRLDEMRRCLSLHFFENTYLSTPQIAELVGCRNHTSVLSQVTQAKGHREYNDQIFMNYYNVLKEVI